MQCVAWLQAGTCCLGVKAGTGGSRLSGARPGRTPVRRLLRIRVEAGNLRTPCGELLLRATPPLCLAATARLFGRGPLIGRHIYSTPWPAPSLTFSSPTWVAAQLDPHYQERGDPAAASAGNPVPVPVHATLNPATTRGRRVLIVGDLHGCYGELCDLLDACSYQEGQDVLISVGDACNRVREVPLARPLLVPPASKGPSKPYTQMLHNILPKGKHTLLLARLAAPRTPGCLGRPVCLPLGRPAPPAPGATPPGPPRPPRPPAFLPAQGPESLAVLRFFLGEGAGAALRRMVRGNHEEGILAMWTRLQ